MKKKHKIQLVLFILILVIFVILATDRKPTEEIIELSIVNLKPGSNVTLSNQSIIGRDGEYFISGKLSNSSDVPITLVGIEIDCSNDEESSRYRLTTATENRVIKEVNEVTGLEEEINQIVPLEIAIGESLQIDSEIKNFTSVAVPCTVEIKNWSEYEGE